MGAQLDLQGSNRFQKIQKKIFKKAINDLFEEQSLLLKQKYNSSTLDWVKNLFSISGNIFGDNPYSDDISWYELCVSPKKIFWKKFPVFLSLLPFLNHGDSEYTYYVGSSTTITSDESLKQIAKMAYANEYAIISIYYDSYHMSHTI